MSAVFTLDDAIALARRAHADQVDKSGRPYIGHPLRVMDNVTGEHEKMVAVLHDVIEDTPVTAEDLTNLGAPAGVVEAVLAISKVPGEAQAGYLARVAANPLALTVKRADIADNSSPERLARLDEPTQRRLTEKYATAIRLLDELSPSA